MHDLAPCNNSKRARTFLENKGIPAQVWPGYLSGMNPIGYIWNIIKKEIGNQIGSEHVKRGIV